MRILARVWKFLVLVSIVVGLTGMIAFQPLQAEEKVIKLGGTFPLSGSIAAYGEEIKHGVELAVDIINNKWPDLDLEIAKWEGIPSLGGAKIKVVIKDDRCEPSRGADLTERLIKDENVVGMIGCYCSSVTKTASTVAERYGVPFLNSTSVSPRLTKRGYQWFWRVGPTDERNWPFLFEFLDSLIKGKGPVTIPKDEIDNLAVANENTEYGKSGGEVIQKVAPEYGFQIDKYILYPHGSPDLTSEVQSLLGVNPDIIMLNPYLSDAILIIQTLKSLQAAPNMIIAQSTVTSPQIAKTLGKDAVGIVSFSGFVPALGESKSISAKIDDIFYERFGTDLSSPSARVFTGMQVWAKVLNKAGSTDPQAIQEAFNEIEIPEKGTIMPWGVKFTTSGEDIGQNMQAVKIPVQWQLPEGAETPELEIIYPYNLATADLIYPLKGWSD